VSGDGPSGVLVDYARKKDLDRACGFCSRAWFRPVASLVPILAPSENAPRDCKWRRGSRSQLYRRLGSQDVMLYTPPQSGVREWYVVRVSSSEVGWVPNNRCWLVSSKGILVKDSADFVGLDNERVHLEWE